MNEKPRGLMIIHNFRPGPTGGAELQAERLATKLVELGHPMQVLTRLSVADAPPTETLHGVQIHRVDFPLPYWIDHDVAGTFRFLVKNRRSYDVCHAHMAFGHAVVALVASRFLRKKCIIKIACAGEYGDLFTFSKLRRFEEALQILHQADRIVAVSRAVEQELREFGFPPERIVIIPNGVDAQAFKRTLSFPTRGRVNFVLVARRHPQKGIDTTLTAIKILIDKGWQNRFVVRFYGEEYPEYDYRKMASELGVEDCIELAPFQKDILGIYHSAHCLLLPSRGEGLSNTLLEGMAMELPVIATRVSGTEDVVEDQRDGILVSPGSPTELATAMEMVMQNADFVASLGRAARIKVESVFSLESVAARYSRLYSNLMGVSDQLPSG